MILVTVGGQLPFDRLVRAVDAWAGSRGRTDVFAQIGDTELRPEHVEWTRFLEPEDFHARLLSADAIVAHAGMGTILTALEHAKPIVVLPRRAALQEQRNDHQLATAERLGERELVRVAMDDEALVHELDAIDELAAGPPIGGSASEELLGAIRSFVSAR